MDFKEGENPTPTAPLLQDSKLEDLAQKSSQKNGGTTAHYISANIALRDDLLLFMSAKFESLQNQINSLKDEVKKSRQREADLLQQVKRLSMGKEANTQPSNKDNIYMVGSSILREVRQSDLKNGKVKAIPGGHIKDIKDNLLSLDYKPNTIVTLVGGNELDGGTEPIDKLVSDYAVAITEAKTKFPDTKMVVAGLPPRHNTVETRTKVKDYNQSMKEWCTANNMNFVDNEGLFEFKSGDVDSGSYIMTGATPAVHLTRHATVRLLENIQKDVPEMILSEDRHKPSSYANAVKAGRNPLVNTLKTPQRQNLRYHDSPGSHHRQQVICWYCGVPGHTKDVCRYGPATYVFLL